MMRAARRRSLLALLPAALVPSVAQAQAGRDAAASAIREAHELLRRSRPEAALARLERAIALLPAAPNGDLLALRLVAAQSAVLARLPDRARLHLDAAERLADAPSPAVSELPLAQLRRELAELRAGLGDMAMAEALLDAALPVLTRADLAAAAATANARGVARRELQRANEAAADFQLSLDLLQRVGRASAADAVDAFVNLALARAEAGDPAAALAAARGARRAAGADPRLRRAADFAEGMARLRAAEVTEGDALLARVAAQSPPTDRLRGHARIALARTRFDRGHMAEAAQEAGAAVEAYRRSLGETHPAYGRALHTLGTARAELGDPAGATALLRRASEVLRASLGADSAQAQAAEVELGLLALRDGRPDEAQARAEAALAAYARRSPPNQRPPGLATILRGLAAEARGEDEAAAAQFRAGQALIEAADGPDSPDLGFSLVRLGRLLTHNGRLTEAAAPLDRAIAIFARVGGTGSVRLADAVTARAELRARLGDREGALDDTQRGLALLRSRLGSAEAAGAVAEVQRRSARELFAAQARLLLALQPGDPGAKADAFAAAQEALATRAGEALRRAALRRAAGPGELARLLRAREAAAEALRQADAQVLDAAALPGGGAALAAAAARRDEAAARLTAADAALERNFPRYARFLMPQPVPLTVIQGMLDPDEALVAPLVSGEGLLVWVVRRDQSEPIQEAMPAAELTKLVNRLRAGLDLGRPGGPEAFDSGAAQQLHAALLGGAEARGLLAGARHLIVVPDGALQRLPLHVLRDARGAWLLEHYAMTVAPSVPAAAAAREDAARPPAAPLGVLAVADPVFSLYAGANAAVPSDELRRSLAAMEPLPETALQVRALALQLGASHQSRVLLREQATERGLQEAGPGRFRVIVLASHAVMAGQLPGLEEPAVILTPGDNPPLDGLLTASDIAAMELDAELVVLSACNTAAPDGGPYAEGLSGLSRAFVQAGARALLVSHWSVAAAEAVALTEAFAEALRAPHIRRRAEALRAAMIVRAFRRPDRVEHPALWAPFVVVGS